MNSDRLKNMTISALFIAMVTMGTLAFRIPVPATSGYINFGDAIIYLGAMLFGPVTGVIIGGIGSALADIVGGYASWAVFTLVIKGTSGFVAGWLSYNYMMGDEVDFKGLAWRLVPAAVITVVGYLAVGVVLYGWAAALVEVPGNLVQVGASIVLSVPMSLLLRKAAMSYTTVKK